MKLEIGKRYVTRNGIVTPPLTPAEDDTDYEFAALIQEPKYPDPSWVTWLGDGTFLCPDHKHRLDLVREAEGDSPA
jgi:hypothetical protein